jgi:hypothetical protein
MKPNSSYNSTGYQRQKEWRREQQKYVAVPAAAAVKTREST